MKGLMKQVNFLAEKIGFKTIFKINVNVNNIAIIIHDSLDG